MFTDAYISLSSLIFFTIRTLVLLPISLPFLCFFYTIVIITRMLITILMIAVIFVVLTLALSLAVRYLTNATRC